MKLKNYDQFSGSGGPVRYVDQYLQLLHAHSYLYCIQMAVKVEDFDVPRPKRQSGRTTQAEGGKRITKYTNSDLPQGALDNNDWRKKFITTYEKWLSARAGPWINDEDENVSAMQAIWDTVYPHIDYTIDVNGPVYYIVSHLFVVILPFRSSKLPWLLIGPTTCL